LALFGIAGCSSTERLYYRPANVASIILPPSVASLVLAAAPVALPAADANQPATITQEATVTKEPEPKQTIRDTIPAHVLRFFERQAGNVENQEKTVRPAPAPAPTPSNNTLGADNRLLQQLEEDLNKANEQPKERHRLQFSKQVINHPKVRQYIKQYTTKAKDPFQTLLSRSGKFMPMILKVLSEEGLPEELGYLALVESELLVHATSQVGAVGLWQFVPATARQYGLRIDNWVDERRDPIKSTRAAVAYLKELYGYYGRWYLVMAAYNAGPTIVNRALHSSKANDFWELKNRSQLTEETRNYVPKFVATSLIANDPKKYGFDNIDYQEPLAFDEVAAEGLLKINELAEMAQSDVATIRDLNPALLRNQTPPGTEGYAVRVPVGKATVFAKANSYLNGKELEPGRLLTHEVKRGETLFSIARHYGQAVATLIQINGLSGPRLQIGQRIKVLFDGIRVTLR
jgi:membrane-bound lytic murein transglycosylase D